MKISWLEQYYLLPVSFIYCHIKFSRCIVFPFCHPFLRDSTSSCVDGNLKPCLLTLYAKMALPKSLFKGIHSLTQLMTHFKVCKVTRLGLLHVFRCKILIMYQLLMKLVGNYILPVIGKNKPQPKCGIHLTVLKLDLNLYQVCLVSFCIW